ncbi:MAG: 50S ribosomal protein L17 [bacterium]
MRHANFGRKLGRSSSHRKSLMRNLATSLLTHGRIRTTFIKAKELQRVGEQLVTLGKRGDLHARRQALTMVFNEAVIARLFNDIAGWYKDRQGGYTRILKLEPRPGDNAPMAFVEFVDRKELPSLNRPVPQKKKFKKPAESKTPAAKSPKGPAGAKAKVKEPAKAKVVAKAPAKAKAKAPKEAGTKPAGSKAEPKKNA